MQVWNVLHAARWKYRMQKSPNIRHLRTISQICRAVSSERRHVWTIGKKRVKQHYLFHMSSQYGRLRPTSGWDRFISLGTPTNFNRFRVLASLLLRRRSPEANQTLHDLWLSPGLVHYIYIFGGFCLLMEFCYVQIHFASKSCTLLLLAALLHGTRVVGVSQTLWRWAEGATYIWQGGHHVGYWPTF